MDGNEVFNFYVHMVGWYQNFKERNFQLHVAYKWHAALIITDYFSNPSISSRKLGSVLSRLSTNKKTTIVLKNELCLCHNGGFNHLNEKNGCCILLYCSTDLETDEPTSITQPSLGI